MQVALIILAVIILGGGAYLLAMRLDRDRIADHIHQRGGRVVSITWAPFGKGWFGEKNARIYEVVYYDADGEQHFATCKTSMWAGVYWTDDHISHHRPRWYDDAPKENRPGDPIIGHINNPDEAADTLSQLQEENRRLREQLERAQAADAPPRDPPAT